MILPIKEKMLALLNGLIKGKIVGIQDECIGVQDHRRIFIFFTGVVPEILGGEL
jgi:hypothetical protein